MNRGNRGLSCRRLLFRIDDSDICSHIMTTSRIYDCPEVKLRLKVLSHYQQFGFKSACHAFSIGKSTLYRWRKKYLDNHKKAISLKKRSTRPHSVRPMEVHPQVVAEIKRLRKAHYRLGKEKIKPLLDRFCLKEGLPAISVSTIGKVIKRNNLFTKRSGRTYHNPNHKRPDKPKRLRKKHSWLPRTLGHLQLDTVVKFQDGLKRYAISVMDIKGKFTLTLVYPQLTSQKALNTLEMFQKVYPVKIKSVQTDNGLEFLGVFDQFLKRHNIPHYFTYPRCPKINAYIERYNRSFQEEFWDHNLHLVHHPRKFHRKLLKYLLFFNTQRVHKGINNQTPMDYLIR